jgi:hypothetical protein
VEQSDVEEDEEAVSSRLSNYVVANYEGQWFLAEVCKDQKNVGRRYTRLSYMLIKGNKSFARGRKPGLHVNLNEDIVLDNVVPEPANSRGHLGLKKRSPDCSPANGCGL